MNEEILSGIVRKIPKKRDSANQDANLRGVDFGRHAGLARNESEESRLVLAGPADRD